MTTCFCWLAGGEVLIHLVESGVDSSAVGEVPLRNGTVPLKAAAMDAYRVRHLLPPGGVLSHMLTGLGL